MSESVLSDRAPDPIERPKIARWLWDRRLSTRWLASRIGVSAEQVRRYCLEFGHPDRSIPGREVLERIQHIAGVEERDFYPPHIRGDDPEPRL